MNFMGLDGIADSALLKSGAEALAIGFPLDGPVPDSQADLTSFANLAGCPAVSIPMGTLPDGMPVGLQLVGARGSDLRLLELAAVWSATLDTAPEYPIPA